MKVKEMIEALSKFDSEAEVLYVEYGYEILPVKIVSTEKCNPYLYSYIFEEFKDEVLWSDSNLGKSIE